MKAFRFVSIIVVLVFLVSSTSPVAANPPAKWTEFFSGNDEYDCGTFHIHDEWTQNSVYQGFFDKQGNMIRLWGMLNATDRFYEDGGKEVSGYGKLVISEDFVYGEVNRIRNMGLAYHVVVPGVGTILIDAGYAEAAPPDWKLILHGKHQHYSGDFDKLCSTLE